MINKERNNIIVNITGDFFPSPIQLKSGLHNEILEGKIKDAYLAADLNITNLECPLTTSNDRIRKSGPHLKSTAEAVKLLKKLNINLVTLANNHILDYGEKGLKETIKLLSESGIEFVGAGENLQESTKPNYLDIKGIRIAILNITGHEFSIAGTGKAGANPVDAIENYQQIMESKANSDLQIVIVHMGIEYYAYPTPAMQKLFRFFAKLEVSAVVCHHSHSVSGYEVYQGVPIFYGLGNFIFDDYDSPSNSHEGMMLQLSFGESKRPEFQSYHFRQMWKDRVLVLQQIDTTLQEEITAEIVETKWREHLNKSIKRRNILNHLQRKGILSRAINKLFPIMAEQGIDHSYLNLLRNESNYEYLLGILEEITVSGK